MTQTYGNPHYWYTPKNVIIAVENIYNGLCRVDSAHKEYYTKRKNEYIAGVRSAFEKLKSKMAPYRDAKVVQYHKSWDYFCRTFGLDVIGELEPKPGIAPSPSHLKEIVDKADDEGASLLLAEPYYPKGPVEFIRRNTNVKVLRLPNYLGGKKGIDSYLENLEYNVNTIAEALSNR